jgi:GGDEF domain-containing protein
VSNISALRSIQTRLGWRIGLVVGGGTYLLVALFSLALLRRQGSSDPSAPKLLIGAFAPAVAIALLAVYSVEQLISRRVRLLAKTIASSERTSFLVRTDNESATDEIGCLAGALNRVMVRITDLTVESIDSSREMSVVRDELTLAEELSKKSILLETRLRQLAFLNELGQDLATDFDVDGVLERFCDRVNRDLAVPEFAVMLYDEQNGVMRPYKSRGLSDSGPDTRADQFEVPCRVSTEATLCKRAVYSADLELDAPDSLYPEARKKSGSLLSVPMVYRGRLIGLLKFSSSHIDAFDEDERAFFSSIANRAALALANVHSYDEATRGALRDPESGLLSRSALEDQLEREIARHQREGTALSLVLVPFPGNDREKDGAYSLVASLEKCLRQGDVLGRCGPSLLMAILPRTPRNHAIAVQKRMLKTLQAKAPFQPSTLVELEEAIFGLPDDKWSVKRLWKHVDAMGHTHEVCPRLAATAR